MERKGLLWGLIWLLALCCTGMVGVIPILAEETGDIDLTLLSPLPGVTTVVRKPTITFRSSELLDRESLLVILDDHDISALVTQKEGIYSCAILQPLPTGNHRLYITAYGQSGQEVEKEFSFVTRQSAMFEEIHSDNRLSVTMKGLLDQSREGEEMAETTGSSVESNVQEEQGFSQSPDISVDTTISSESGFKEGRLQSSLQANLRYFEQNKKLAQPQKKGVNLVNFLLSSRYGGERNFLSAELGDTTVDGSENTIGSLSRRGLKAELTVGDFMVQGFGVLGAEKLSGGEDGDEMGLGFDANDHIMGALLQGKFLDERLRARVLYINGGQQEDSLGEWSDRENRRGDVSGLVLTGELLGEKLVVEGEYDISSFSYDTYDLNGTEEKEDKAYRLKAGGNAGVYQYELSYKYFGPCYQVVGGRALQDWAGFELSASRNGEEHGLQLFSSYSHDNVEDDPLYATLYSFTSGLGWNYSGWEHLPFGLQVEYTSQQSEDEPMAEQETSMQTSTISGDISYLDENWSLSLMSSYSEQDDRTEADYDTRLFSIGLTPAYTTEFLSLFASWNFNSSWDLSTDVRFDTNTLTLDASTSLFDNTLSIEAGATYDITTADDDSAETDTLSLYTRLNYTVERLWKLENSTIALECTHNYQEDGIIDTTRENTVFSVVLTSSLSLSL